MHEKDDNGRRKYMIFDMHCDTLYRIRTQREKGKDVSLRDGGILFVNLEQMKKSDYGLQNFAVFIDKEERESPYEDAMELVGIFEEEMRKNSDLVRQVCSASEISDNRREGKMSAMLTLEEGAMCEGDPEKLKEFYNHGARMMTICWNYENELGYAAACQAEGTYGRTVERTYGLKKKGFVFLEEMEHLGMIPDVSHLSDDGFFDVCRICKKPFVASHSNARAVCAHRRNLTDEMLHALGDHGGVAGLNFCPEFVSLEQERSALLDALAEHAVHMIRFGGRECVGIGSDLDGFRGESAPRNAQDMDALVWALHRKGLTESEIDGILWKNVMRVYQEVLG